MNKKPHPELIIALPFLTSNTCSLLYQLLLTKRYKQSKKNIKIRSNRDQLNHIKKKRKEKQNENAKENYSKLTPTHTHTRMHDDKIRVTKILEVIFLYVYDVCVCCVCSILCQFVCPLPEINQ